MSRSDSSYVASRSLRRSAVASAVAVALLMMAVASPAIAVAATATTSTAEFRSELAVARAAVERRDWADALPRWRALEAAAPHDVDLLIESARVHGFADRNADAAQRYRKVIELAPGRRADVLLSLAWQTHWAGDPAGAETLFMEIASRPAAYAGGGDGFDAWRGVAETRRNAGRLGDSMNALEQALRLRPDDRGTRRQVAQTLAWLDRHDESIAAYTQLVEEDPVDRHSAFGLARARNDAGRHREAVADYRKVVAAERAAGRTPPPDVLFDNARALRWAGYDDLAHHALQGLPDPEARWLRDFRTGRELRPWADGGVEYATDSDELDTRVANASFGLRATAASSLEVGVRWVELTEPTRESRGERLGLTWRTRLGASADTIGSSADRGPAWARLSVQGNRYDDWHPVTGAARAHWLPTSFVRVDGELGREVVETPRAISNRVQVDVAAFGAAWRWQPRSSVAATVSALDFSDSNLRLRLNVRADHVVSTRPLVTLGIEAMAFRSSDPTSDAHPYVGYWNPRKYSEARAFVTVSHEARPWDVALKLGLGTAREEDGWGNPSSGNPNLLELSAGYDLNRSLRLRAYAGGSGGSMGVASGGEGYWRRYGGFGLTGWF
jgi:tetratricopeptide (TPR) repeat protein